MLNGLYTNWIGGKAVDFTAFTDSMYMIATHYEKGLLDKILIQQDVTMV